MQAVDDVAFVIALVVVDFHIGVVGFDCLYVIFHRQAAVDVGFAHSEQIEVGSVDNKYSCHIGLSFGTRRVRYFFVTLTFCVGGSSSLRRSTASITSRAT